MELIEQVNCIMHWHDGIISCQETKGHWHFQKHDYKLVDNGRPDDRDGCDISRTYETIEEAYKASVEYAHSQGERLLFRVDNVKYIDAHTPTFDWNNFHYKIKLATNYRPFLLEEAEDYLGLKVKRKEGNNRKLVDNVYNQDELDSYFEYYTKLDGTVVGKEIR